MKQTCFSIALFLILFTLKAQQIEIDRINQMPEIPQPYEMRDWKKVAMGYDSLVFNTSLSGDYLPLVTIYPTGTNYPNHSYFGIQSYVGSPDSDLEAINVLAATIGATLCGIDKTNDYNWVIACEEFFNKANNQLVYLNNPNTNSGNDWWYDVMPNVFFYQLNYLYPNTGDFDNQFTSIANRWLQAVKKMGGNTTPWSPPYMNYRAFNLITGLPLETGIPEPESAGSIAWILYNTYLQTQDKKYLIGAEMCLEFLNNWDSNPSYELQLPYGLYTAARMNAEIGTNYNIEKMFNWAFNIGELRHWGAIIGTWNGYDVSGLIGESRSNFADYAFNMNGMEQMGALVPLVKYDDRFANAIGKWCLNVANASRLFYGKYLPEENQTNANWIHAYDPHSYIAYEALKEIENTKSPMATGDAMSGGWAETNLGLYGSSHVGIFGSIIQITDVEAILKLDLNATDYYAENNYPTFLIYNPYNIEKTILLCNSPELITLYDGISNQVVATGVSGEIHLSIPPKSSMVTTILPNEGTISTDGRKTRYNGNIIDYNNGSSLSNTPPRIKALATENNPILKNSEIHIYCTVEDLDEDDLLFAWTINGDEFEASSILTHTFSEIGSQSIQCIVSDSASLSDTAYLMISVVDKIIEPPVIEFISASPPKIKTASQSILFCKATDPNLDTLTYQWGTKHGNVDGEEKQATYTSPQLAGIYYITCMVTNEDHLSTTDSLAIIVYDTSTHTSGNTIASYQFSNSVWDYSGNGHHGMANNCTYVKDYQGNPLESLSFTSSNSYVTIPNQPSLNFEDGLSVSFLVKPTSILNHEMFILSHGSWEQRWKVSILENKKLRFTINSTQGICDIDSKTKLEENEYYHVVGTFDGTTMELYINGELESFSEFTGQINPSTLDLVMGRNTPGSDQHYFNGIVDDVRLFDYGLMYEEVQNLFHNDLSIITDRIQFDFPFNVFPNPVTGHVAIKFNRPLTNSVLLELYSIDGELILTQQIQKGNIQTSMDLTRISPGLYIIKVIGDILINEKKIVVY